MISYRRLWEAVADRGAATYTLQAKGGISGSIIRRLRAGEPVSTNTLDAPCKILDCGFAEMVEYLPGEEWVRRLIAFDPLWEALKRKELSRYVLTKQYGVSTGTLDAL